MSIRRAKHTISIKAYNVDKNQNVHQESQAYNVDRNPFIVERRGYRDPDDPR